MSITESTPTATEISQDGVSNEDLLHSSQSAHYHAIPQAIRFPGDLDDGQRADVQEHFDAGEFEPVPVQVTARNRQGEPVRVRSQWDGVQLHLDVCPTEAPMLALRPALAAMARYYRDHLIQLAALIVTTLVLTALFVAVGLSLGVMGAL